MISRSFKSPNVPALGSGIAAQPGGPRQRSSGLRPATPARDAPWTDGTPRHPGVVAARPSLACAPASSGGGTPLALAAGGRGARGLLAQQQLPQRVQVVAQDRQAHVAPVAREGAIAAALQAVAPLQHPDQRLHPRVRPPCLGPGGRGLLRLRLALLGPTDGDTHDGDDLTQLLLIGRAVKAPVKGSALEAGEALLELGHLRDDDVRVLLPGLQDPVVTDKARAVFDDQHLVAELNRLGLLATLDQFRVRLKEAEDF